MTYAKGLERYADQSLEMAGSNQGSDNKKNNSSFTVDSDFTGSDMPSVTKLLNRKSLKSQQVEKTKTEIPSGENESTTLVNQPDKAPIPDPIEVKFDMPSGEPAPAQVKPAVRTRTGLRASATSQLLVWDIPTLKNGTDPLGQALASLLSRGIHSALFLKITPPQPGKPPFFEAAAAVQVGASRQLLWSGLKWDPTVVPELWNKFVREGMAEISPPETQTQANSPRNMVRGAFGIERDEWLTLVRVGPANACRGVIALVSRTSITLVLKEREGQLLSLFQAPFTPSKAA